MQGRRAIHSPGGQTHVRAVGPEGQTHVESCNGEGEGPRGNHGFPRVPCEAEKPGAYPLTGEATLLEVISHEAV